MKLNIERQFKAEKEGNNSKNSKMLDLFNSELGIKKIIVVIISALKKSWTKMHSLKSNTGKANLLKFFMLKNKIKNRVPKTIPEKNFQTKEEMLRKEKTHVRNRSHIEPFTFFTFSSKKTHDQSKTNIQQDKRNVIQGAYRLYTDINEKVDGFQRQFEKLMTDSPTGLQISKKKS